VRNEVRGMATAHDHKKPAVADIDALEAANPHALLTRKQCQTIGNWAATSQMMKEASGALHRVNVGMRVMITAPSFFGHLRALASAEQKKLRQLRTMFRRRPRERTPQELEGLRRGNEGRHQAAQKRREAKAARV
jgi:hypothetical protein